MLGIGCPGSPTPTLILLISTGVLGSKGIGFSLIIPGITGSSEGVTPPEPIICPSGVIISEGIIPEPKPKSFSCGGGLGGLGPPGSFGKPGSLPSSGCPIEVIPPPGPPIDIGSCPGLPGGLNIGFGSSMPPLPGPSLTGPLI